MASISRWLVGSSSSRISGSADERLSEQDAPLHPGGKVFEARIRVQAHARDHGLHAMIRSGRGMVGVVQSVGHLVGDRAGLLAGDILGQASDAQALLADDLAFVGLDLASDQPQERALAFTVATQQADPLSWLDLQLDLVE